jgi:predicted nucleic acid-binding protein
MSHDRNDLKIPSVVAFELIYGANKSARALNNIKLTDEFLDLFEVVPFDRNAADV